MPLLSWDERNAPQYYTETYLHSGLHGFDFSALLGLCLVWKCQARKTNFRVLKKICKVVVKNRIPSSMCFRIAYIVIRVLKDLILRKFCKAVGFWDNVVVKWKYFLFLLSCSYEFSWLLIYICSIHDLKLFLLVLWCINMITFHKWKKHFHSNRKKKNFSALPMVSYIIFPG